MNLGIRLVALQHFLFALDGRIFSRPLKKGTGTSRHCVFVGIWLFGIGASPHFQPGFRAVGRIRAASLRFPSQKKAAISACARPCCVVSYLVPDCLSSCQHLSNVVWRGPRTGFHPFGVGYQTYPTCLNSSHTLRAHGGLSVPGSEPWDLEGIPTLARSRSTS